MTDRERVTILRVAMHQLLTVAFKLNLKDDYPIVTERKAVQEAVSSALKAMADTIEI